MSLRPQEISPVPEETCRVAKAAFRKGNIYLRMRDEIGPIFDDPMFAPLFPSIGQPAECPWRLALVTVLQFVEGLSDRQAAEAVRGRIDWKYALGLELVDSGFDASVLCAFRLRLIAGGQEHSLLEAMLASFKQRGLLKARGQHRTDSTHVLAAVRTVNRLELVGETLRAALNDLATAAPDWLNGVVAPDWFERYATRLEEYKFPKGEAARTALAETIGADGHRLLAAVYAPAAPEGVRDLAAVQTLRLVWVHQFHVEGEIIRLRKADDLPPTGIRFDSPYDIDAHYGKKRATQWSGYKVHLTETCDPETPHLVINVETTPSPVNDVTMTAHIHQDLADQQLSPSTHLVDAGYIAADLLVESRATHGIEIVGPVLADNSWPARQHKGFDISGFTIDWDAQKVTCPEHQTSCDWKPDLDHFGNACIDVRFPRRICSTCPSLALCTRSKARARQIMLRPRPQHDALQERRRQQETDPWRKQYGNRAGIEGTLSQAVRRFGLRCCRYLGLPKTRLQHIITALAMHVVRFDAWLTGRKPAKTRRSSFLSIQPQAA